MTKLKFPLPEKLGMLLEPNRYKVLYGGRGGAKSWGIAQVLLIQAYQKPLLVLCTREIQKSIQESVHRLLADQIVRLGLEAFYEVQSTRILGKNGSEFLFAGLRHNVASLKSYEGVDRCWVEEAQVVSKSSWDVLIPTIRKPGSEIWASFNPDLEDDETYQRLVVSPPTGAKIVKIGWRDNPWFPDVLRQEMEDLKKRDYAAYLHVWEGECRQAVEGAIFAKEMALAAEEQRFTRVPVMEGVPVQTYWDLGQSDNTAIWFVQLVGMEYRLIDYYQGNGEKMPHYLGILAKRGYLYGNHCLPHDAEHDQIAAEKNILEQFRDACRNNPALGKPENVKIVERTPKKANAIAAARNIFPRCVFDKEKTADGLQCLRRYRYAVDLETGKIGKQPTHDMWSHGADAFLALGQYAKPVVKDKPINYDTKWVV